MDYEIYAPEEQDAEQAAWAALWSRCSRMNSTRPHNEPPQGGNSNVENS